MSKKKIAITVVVILLLILAVVIGMRWYATRTADKYLKNKNVQAFLKSIRYAEGTDGANGYTTMFTGKQFTSFADHPRQTNCKGSLCSTAAGAYQFLETTWDYLRFRLSLPDFSPKSQDMAAIELLRENDALELVVAGDFAAAVNKVNKVWASLPGAPYGQPTKTLAELSSYYSNQGGGLA